jgi:hypothetical protein
MNTAGNRGIFVLLSLGALYFLYEYVSGGTMSGYSIPPKPPSSGDINLDNKIYLLAQAVAHAEGFGVPNGIPTRANNPGDLAVGDLGNGVLGTSKVTVFSTVTEGWNRLFAIIHGWLTGSSQVYFLGDSIREVARKYVNGPSANEDINSLAWANNIVTVIGGDVSNTLQDFLGG